MCACKDGVIARLLLSLRESRASKCVSAHTTTDMHFRIHRSRFSFEVQGGRGTSPTREGIKPLKYNYVVYTVESFTS
jgi:hypothetical protein